MVRMILPKQELFIINGLANERCEEMIKKHSQSRVLILAAEQAFRQI